MARVTNTSGVKQYVTWMASNHFMARELTAADMRNLGATEDKKVRWDNSNDFRVERSEIPLSDEQLAALMESDSAFNMSKV